MDKPIFVGLRGPAGAGKTSVGNRVAGMTRPDDYDKEIGALPSQVFLQYTLATPIYDIVGIKRMTKGFDRKDRILYSVHDSLHELLNRQLPYEDFVSLVRSVADMDAGDEFAPKPRTFMQTLGDMCRNVDVDCYANAVVRRAYADITKINQDYADYAERMNDDDEAVVEDPAVFAVVTDLRYQNEIDVLRNAGELILIRLDASRETLNQRIYDRDGVHMTEEQWNHPTETELSGMDDNEFNLIINTDNFNANEVSLQVKKYLLSLVKKEAAA